MDENDANKNRKYPELDSQIQDTYVQPSRATNKTALYDPYIKAIHWALDRVKANGIVAFVTNHNFIAGQAFDGMRKQLAETCDAIYLLDLGGNIRKGHGGDSNVFDIQVGVSINLFVKIPKQVGDPLVYFTTARQRLSPKRKHLNFWTRAHTSAKSTGIPFNPMPDIHGSPKGYAKIFETFLPIGSKQAKTVKGEISGVIFHQFSNGVKTNRDAWTINFHRKALTKNVQRMIEFYNAQVLSGKV